MPTAPLTAIESQIVAAEQTAARLADERKTEQARLQTALGNNIDKDAYAARKRIHELDEGVAFEETRISALKARRADLVEAERIARLEDQWAKVEQIVERRARAAQLAADAAKALGEATAELSKLTTELHAALPDPKLRPVGDDEVRTGVIYSLIGSGIRWFPNSDEAHTAGNGIADRVARSNAALLAARNASLRKAA